MDTALRKGFFTVICQGRDCGDAFDTTIGFCSDALSAGIFPTAKTTFLLYGFLREKSIHLPQILHFSRKNHGKQPSLPAVSSIFSLFLIFSRISVCIFSAFSAKDKVRKQRERIKWNRIKNRLFCARFRWRQQADWPIIW